MTQFNEDWKSDRIGSALRGENPLVITEMSSGFAVMGDTQFLPGYCVFLPKKTVESLEALAMPERTAYLSDASLVGEAVLRATGAKRINYSIYGNTDAFLHTHIFPRYHSEPPERISRPVWDYRAEHWKSNEDSYKEEQHGLLRDKIATALTQLMEEAYPEKDV